ncbi:MAG: transposase [Pseudomonas sp.]|nr:transposase [Pseudomonas sp.]
MQESGVARGHSSISRPGSARLRTALYLPAVVVPPYNPAIKAQAERLRARGKRGKQAICERYASYCASLMAY